MKTLYRVAKLQFNRRCMSADNASIHVVVCSRIMSMSTSSSSDGTTDDSSPGSTAGRSAFDMRHKIDCNNQWKTSMSTKLSHAGLSTTYSTYYDEKNYNSPLSPPIELATTYERPPSGDYGENGLIYSRSCNPTRKLLEDTMGQLEMDDNTTIAPTFAFSSGMAAVASLLLACKSPVKMLIPKDVYHGVPTQLHTSLNDHGIIHESVDMTNCNEIRQTIKENIISSNENEGTLVVWIETPSNPLCQVTDIQAVCNVVQEMRRSRNNESENRILCVVDSTWAPPVITKPLSFGADAVLHSGTKFLGGHSDVLLGIVSCSPITHNGQWLGERLKKVQTSVGAVASPLECWLTLRGLRTLHLRVERQCQTAMELAKYLNGHKHVVQCHYPGLESHPQYAIAKQQMIGKNSNMFGGMLSFEVQSEEYAMAVAGAVSIIKRATSLGGTETLIEHRKSIEPPESTCPPGLLRLSCGLEDVKDLIHDLETALDVASQICGKDD